MARTRIAETPEASQWKPECRRTRTTVRTTHRRQKAREKHGPDMTRGTSESEVAGEETADRRCEGSENGGVEADDLGRAVESRRRVSENPPPGGRRRALVAQGQHGVEDSGFAKMTEARRRVEEIPPPRGRRNGRFKMFEQEPYLGTERMTLAERARAQMERRERTRLGKSSQTLGGNRRSCSLLTGAGKDNLALSRTDRTDWREARSGAWHFVAELRVGELGAVAIWLPRVRTTVVIWQEGEIHARRRLTREEEYEARRAMKRGDEVEMKAICSRARRIRALGDEVTNEMGWQKTQRRRATEKSGGTGNTAAEEVLGAAGRSEVSGAPRVSAVSGVPRVSGASGASRVSGVSRVLRVSGGIEGATGKEQEQATELGIRESGEYPIPRIPGRGLARRMEIRYTYRPLSAEWRRVRCGRRET
jgi:hypothetical protein